MECFIPSVSLCKQSDPQEVSTPFCTNTNLIPIWNFFNVDGVIALLLRSLQAVDDGSDRITAQFCFGFPGNWFESVVVTPRWKSY